MNRHGSSCMTQYVKGKINLDSLRFSFLKKHSFFLENDRVSMRKEDALLLASIPLKALNWINASAFFHVSYRQEEICFESHENSFVPSLALFKRSTTILISQRDC